jgi:protein-tyrosine phosphatase/membrane-associated phospholipid phosphatase
MLRRRRERQLWAEAVLYSVALSLTFVFVYGGCNSLASRRTELASCFFAWELRIPFVPALILPYLSIDLFFIASFLLCANRIELRAHARRIAFAILVAGAAFLVFPLTVGYARPDVSGWTAGLFEFLWAFDKPHNLVPSLHVALASLLWPVYSRHTRGPLRWFVHGWFALIIASPLLTWQHHVLDVATGAMLGQVCLFVFPERPDSSLERSSPNLRVAGFYALGSAALGILAIALGSWFWILIWPASSLAIINASYIRGNSAVFRKTNGRLPVSTRVVLGPYLLGACARRLIYRRGREPWVEASPGVYFGRLLTRREALVARSMGVTGVLDLTAEHAETRALLEIEYLNPLSRSLERTEYLNVPVVDLTEPSPEQLDLAVAFIAKHAHRGGVYVHCALGVSRSAAVLSNYLSRSLFQVMSRPPVNPTRS